MKTKMKTKKIVAKRFKVTSTGKLMRGKQNARHLRSHKSKRQLRKYNVRAQVSKGLEQTVRIFLPYG
ncbi:MAG: 50S ribosomal protein L35 [Candidatus Gottesmanbacteria bacterium GW2011_GWC1_43_10]|nr:MAG: 50S ribosomal protein L35 [Candidatus Gottesmanbacteria bacterium GW2011_GWA1_42_26]KKS80082.1 MAG: 50S ribosomal protein L35 [Candidatus Gottesmanbacteria bacterium GW2011_GWC1_43_10]OGG10292.1 MAG: 50S ribosomal protein L35 [Candidatus Gottesmanbacteria bacterium RIFCSPHIGHO2_01_FULL_43_15]HCM37495.1 50S ribosomal protein L35 [Patescibacteria group bacterium]